MKEKPQEQELICLALFFFFEQPFPQEVTVNLVLTENQY